MQVLSLPISLHAGCRDGDCASEPPPARPGGAQRGHPLATAYPNLPTPYPLPTHSSTHSLPTATSFLLHTRYTPTPHTPPTTPPEPYPHPYPPLPKVYCSATGVSEIGNLAYMTRLGFWGVGSAFATSDAFIDSMKKRGLGARVRGRG